MRARVNFPSDSKVANYVNDMLKRHPERSLNALAADLGIVRSRSTFLTQVRAGRTKLPMHMIIPLCNQLNEDPEPLFRIAMKEYYPDILKTAADLAARRSNKQASSQSSEPHTSDEIDYLAWLSGSQKGA